MEKSSLKKKKKVKILLFYLSAEIIFVKNMIYILGMTKAAQIVWAWI